MTAHVENEALILSCAGGELLRLRARLVAQIDGVRTLRGGIAVPRTGWARAVELLPDLGCPELDSFKKGISAHQAAVARAREELQESVVTRVPKVWAGVLDPPQQYAVNALLTPGLKGLCLFDEQGIGKTVMAIAAFDSLVAQERIRRAVVIAPKTMLGGWAKDFATFVPNRYRVTIVDGNAAQRRRLVESSPDVLVCNYEGVESVLVPLKTRARSDATLLIVDESYFAKNPEAVRSRLLNELRPTCAQCFVLCGTPAPHAPYDVINQVNLADGGYAFSGFSRSGSEAKDRERIRAILDTRGLVIRRLKEEVLPDVPRKNFVIVRIKLEGRQFEMYQKALQNLVVELKTLNNKTFRKWLTSYFQRRAALLEICASPRMVDPLYDQASAKLSKLEELVAELHSQGRKVLIWTSYRSSVEEIRNRLAQLNPLVIDGSVVGGKARAKIVADFQTNPDYGVLIANPAAAGAGITLHAAYDAIYYSYTNQAAHHLQSLDRIHRRGQKSPNVYYYMLVCENTIEENEVRRIRRRELEQHELLGDCVPWPESLDDALAELSPEDSP